MDAFCGSSFWDPNLTVYTDNPDLTPCFQNTILAWIPCLYLGCLLPFYLIYLKFNNRGYIVLSVLSRFKTVFAFLLWCVCWANLFYSFHGIVQGTTPPTVYFVSPLIVGITMLLAMLLIQYERLHGVQSSGVLIIFWFLCFLCALSLLRSKIIGTSVQNPWEDRFRTTTFYIRFVLIVIELILSCIQEKSPFFSPVNLDPNPCPELNSSFLSHITFWWFTRMAVLGYRRPLEEKDLWSLNNDDKSEVVVQKLQKQWEKEKQRSQLQKDVSYIKGSKLMLNHVDESPEEAEVLIGSKIQQKEPSFLKALLKTFGPYFLIGSLFKLIQDLLAFVNPQLLRRLSFTSISTAALLLA